MSIVQLVRQKSQKQDYLQFSLFLFQSQRIPATIMGENQQNRKENQSNPPGLDRKIRDRSQSYVRQGGQSIANLWSPFLFGQSKYQSIKYFIFKHLLVVRCHLVKWVINIFMDGIVNIVWAAAHFCTWGRSQSIVLNYPPKTRDLFFSIDQFDWEHLLSFIYKRALF